MKVKVQTTRVTKGETCFTEEQVVELVERAVREKFQIPVGAKLKTMMYGVYADFTFDHAEVTWEIEELLEDSEKEV